MSIFDEYCTALQNAVDEMRSKIRSLRSKDGSCSIKDVETLYESFGDLIKQTDLEIRSHDSATRRTMTETMKQYKDAQTDIKRDIDEIKYGVNKGSLTGKSVAEVKQRTENKQAQMERQNETILGAIRTCAETEELANTGIMPTLRENREKIGSAQEKTTEISGIIDRAQKHADSMTRRHKTWGFF